MDKKELAKQIYEMEKKAENAQTKRNIITIAIFALVFFLIFCLAEKPTGIYDVLGTAVLSLMVATAHVVINAGIFGRLYEISESERKTIKALREQLDNTTL